VAEGLKIEDLRPYGDYKPAGLGWLGDVPKHWDIAPLGALTRLKSVVNQPDRQLLSVYLQRGVVRFSDVNEKRTNATSEDLSNYQAVEPGDFVLNNQQAWRGSVGVSQLYGIVSPAYLVIKLSNRFSSNYANQLLRDRNMVAQYLISSKGVGTIQRNLYWPHLKRNIVLVPPIDEQNAIVRFLGWSTSRLDRAIRAKRKVIALLNEQKQAIIHRAVTLGLDSSVALKPTGIPWLGEIPKHWEVIPARYLFRAVTRRDIRGDEPKMSVTQRHGLVPTAEMEENSTQAQSYDRFQLCHPDDLVLNKYKAHLGVFWASVRRGLITPNYTVFKPTQRAASKYFEHLFHTQTYRDAFSMVVYGVIQGMCPLYTQDFYRIPCLCPSKEEQVRIVDALVNMTKSEDIAITRLEREIDLLYEYRTRLVSDVVTGKLDAREAALNLPDEASVEAAEDVDAGLDEGEFEE